MPLGSEPEVGIEYSVMPSSVPGSTWLGTSSPMRSAFCSVNHTSPLRTVMFWTSEVPPPSCEGTWYCSNPSLVPATAWAGLSEPMAPAFSANQISPSAEAMPTGWVPVAAG